MHETLDRRGTITVPCLHCGEPMVTMRHLVICAGENPDKRWELLKCSKCASGGPPPTHTGLTARQRAKVGMIDS